jgi:hypothetical protein
MEKKYKPIAEDEVVVIEKDSKVLACPVLFSNKLESDLLVSECFEIGKILTIEKDVDLNLKKMSPKKALLFLLDQSKIVANKFERAKLVIKYASLLSDKVYILGYKKNDNLDDIIRELNL